MKKRARICLYVFLICSVISLGIAGYFIFNKSNDNVMLGSKKFVTFNSVKDASAYSVEVTNNTNYSGQAIYKVDKQEILNRDGNLDGKNFKYKIIVEIDNQKKAEENYIQRILNEYSDGKIDCNIEDYTINFFNTSEPMFSREFVDQKLLKIDKDSFCFVVSEYFDNMFKNDGEYTVKCTPLDESMKEMKDNEGNSLSSTEKFKYIAFYKEDFLRKENFFYDGIWYDFVIENLNEFKALVDWNILYRQSSGTEETRFYVDTTTIYPQNINGLVFDAINEYPEYDALEYSPIYASMTGHIGKLFNFNYYLDKNFTLNYTDLQAIDEANGTNFYNKAIANKYKHDKSFDEEYIVSSYDADGRTFKINSVEKPALVYNTEQLFMVVQSGGKPQFDNEKSAIAKQVYDNALLVLKKINNSDALTDYEKALNIYRYLTSNVIYDHVIYNYMGLVKDYSIRSFGNYSAFYLEGVFLGNMNEDHFAVCDGLSKAYSLLCNIEGIDCIKVNGQILGEEYGSHAWNRVHLIDEQYNVNGFYYVDTTWGEGTYIGENNQGYQILTHERFLYKHNPNNRIIEYPKNLEENEPSSDYDYYKGTKHNYKGNEFDNYIESDEELKQFLTYSNAKCGFSRSPIAELKFDRIYLNKDNKLSQLNALSREIMVLQNRINLLRNEISSLDDSVEKTEKQERLNVLQAELSSKKTEHQKWFSDMGITNKCEWIQIDGDLYIFRIFMIS